MKNKKSFQDLMKQMSELSEDQQGKLKGGFSAFSASANAASVDTSVSVSVTVAIGSSCSCSCGCQVE
jgi:hypothetical protein